MPGISVSYRGVTKWIRLPDGIQGVGLQAFLDRNYGPVQSYWRKKTTKRRPSRKVK